MPSPRPPLEALDSPDDKSLRLSALPLTPGLLDVWMEHQKAWLKAANAMALASPSDLAAVHRAAAEAVPMDAGALAALDALCRGFCAQRWAFQALEQKKSGKGDRVLLPKQRALLEERLQGEQGKLSRLMRRYGEEAIDLLLAREDELLALHVQREAVVRRIPLIRD
jgi:hypothetical protein